MDSLKNITIACPFHYENKKGREIDSPETIQIKKTDFTICKKVNPNSIKKNQIEVVEICGVKFNNWEIDDFSKYISNGVRRNGKAITIVTPNVDFLVLANKDRIFRKILNDSDQSICDSAIIYFTSRIIGKKIQSRITGCDVMEMLLNVADVKKEKMASLA